MMKQRARAGMRLRSGLIARPGLAFPIRAPRVIYAMECIGAGGRVKWRDSFGNIVTTGGLNSLLDVYFDGATQITSWYLGLVSGASPTFAAADTLASHGGWTEFTDYTGDRKAITWGEPSSGSLAASSAVSFSITGSGTIGGAFVTSAETGTSGTLYSEGDLDADRSVANGDTLNCTPTLTAADDGA